MSQEIKKNMVWQADLGNGMYRNPILHLDYSDPDVVRVGDTYYMTASSFNYMPGLPILESKDLVNWKIVNYAVKHLPYEVYNTPAHAKGVWAPSIRYHDNKFWIFVGMPDEGIFMTNTTDVYGEWSPLTCIYEAKGFIDPCPIWDEDGKAYVIHAYAKSRIGFKSILGIFEMTWDGTKAISEDKFIYDGNATQPTIEGPKVYKRDGEYYIFAPAGGVKTGWQTVLKSKNIYGPYDEKIVMHQGNAKTNGPHQGGLVDTVNGEERYVHFQDKGAYGRIVHLQPVTWKDGWPIIGIDKDGIGIGEPVDVYRKPDNLNLPIYEPDTSDDFDNEELGLQWQWSANEGEGFYSLKEKMNSLCLYALNTSKADKAKLWESANVLTQKIPSPSFIGTTVMDYSNLTIGDRAGMIMLGGQYSSLYVEKTEMGLKLNYMESTGDGETREESHEEITILDGNKIYLSVEFFEEEYSMFSYRNSEAEEWNLINKKFSPTGAVWVGAKMGMYAVRDERKDEKGFATFDYFKVESTNN